MPETAFFKLFVAIVVTFILVLPEFFKTPKGRTQELACREVCLPPNLTYPLPFFNFSSVASLQPAEETQTVMGIFPNHSSSQSFAEICQGITSGFPMCSLCLVCESSRDVDFMSQEQTSKGLIMRGSMEVKANDFYSPCQHFNVTVALLVDAMKEYNTTCTPETHPGKYTTIEDPTREDSLNHTCRIMGNTSNCTHISMSLEMDVKPVTCSVKITWYILVLLVFMGGIILIIHKVLEDHRRVQRWQSHKSKSTSFLLRGSDSVKLSTLNVRVIPDCDIRKRDEKLKEEMKAHTESSERPLEGCPQRRSWRCSPLYQNLKSFLQCPSKINIHAVLVFSTGQGQPEIDRLSQAEVACVAFWKDTEQVEEVESRSGEAILGLSGPETLKSLGLAEEVWIGEWQR